MSAGEPVNTTNISDQSPSTEEASSTEPSAIVSANRPNTPSTFLRPSLSWQSVRSSISLSEKTSANLGWVIALLSVIFTLVALSPTFRSQKLSEQSLQLAEWTALKDYIEECREELAAGIQSQACVKAMNARLPPPPYVKPGILERKRGVFSGQNGTNSYRNVGLAESNILKVSDLFIWLGSLVVVYLLVLLLRTCTSRSDRTSRSGTTHRLSDNGENELQGFDRPLLDVDPAGKPVTSTIRHPPSPTQSSLRRRAVRTHPIYRHANLEEAIYHQDMSEIRLRLVNGEDVNHHWPYLIYKLAITPPSADTPKHIEIARLCLDFGADVNALKGWNGQSALMIAIHFGNLEVAKLLIVNGAMVSYSPPDSNLTALHRCVRLAVTGSATDALDIMELLFQHGANANQADRAGETPLHKLLIDAWLKRDNMGCMKKLAPVALCLVDHGAYMPKTLKEKYVIGNPVWQVVRGAILKTTLADKKDETPVAKAPLAHGRRAKDPFAWDTSFPKDDWDGYGLYE